MTSAGKDKSSGGALSTRPKVIDNQTKKGGGEVGKDICLLITQSSGWRPKGEGGERPSRWV